MANSSDLDHIVAGCKAGDNASFSRLVDLYGRRCYGYFYRLTGSRDVSDDLLSELFAKLVLKIRTYDRGSFESWLFTVASNVFHDWLRSKQREQKLMESRVKQLEEQKTESKASDGEKLDELQNQLSRLDDDTRELIMLRFYSQASFKEIAEMRSEPIGTTLSKLHRGLKKLREAMGQ
jgi:RNA polymerase sigma-70 factor (ECF subfamily)